MLHMVRFNYFSGIMMLGALSVISSGCHKHDSPRESGPVNVEVQVIGNGTSASDDSSAYSGTVESADESVTSFSLPGTITHIYVKEGDRVTRGQVLARIKSESLGDQRNIAVAELEQVRDLYNRLKKLHDQNALPDVKWVEVQAKLKQAENAVSLADRAVGDATITSPITGYVAEKLANEGQSVLPSQPVIRVVNTANLQIAISVPEEDINRFGKSASADVSFDALGGTAVQGTNPQRDVVADPLTRSYRVKFTIPDAGGKILPGMIGNVAVTGLDSAGVSHDSHQYVVPSKAVLLSSDNRRFVWVVSKGKAERRFVTANEFRTDGVAIESGLSKGDSLIVSGMQKVSTGTEVKAVSTK